MSGLVEWAIFLALSAIAVVTAGGMLVTMSMYRAGLALMSSFLALAGLFILLDADLLAAIQVMMNVGGMLVMVLFMVMLMMDPGGEMMWDMKRKMHLPGPGAFSMRMPRDAALPAAQQPEVQDPEPKGDWTCPMHPDVRQDEPGSCPKCGMDLVPMVQHAGHRDETSGQDGQPVPSNDDMHSGMAMDHSGSSGSAMGGMNPQQHREMMVGMAMSTAQALWALALGAALALALIVLMVRTVWPLSATGPTQDATVAVGQLLLSRYMIGFEGAAFLILAGIAGAVIFASRAGEPPAPMPLPVTPATERQVYTCPMHPEVRQAGPGTCPKCGMDLVPERDAPSHSATGHPEGSTQA